MNMDGDTGDRASAIRSEIRVSLLDEWRFRAKQAWAEIDTLQAENARLCAQVSILEAGRCTSCMEPINPLHQQCACSRAEFEMLYHQLNETDTLRTQAEALATALEHACSGQLSKVEWARVVDEADAALRAYREASETPQGRLGS